MLSMLWLGVVCVGWVCLITRCIGAGHSHLPWSRVWCIYHRSSWRAWRSEWGVPAGSQERREQGGGEGSLRRAARAPTGAPTYVQVGGSWASL